MRQRIKLTCPQCFQIFETVPSEIKRGRKCCSEKCMRIFNSIKNERAYNWKGDKVKYQALHSWIRDRLGQPTKCEHCKKDGLKGRAIHWANKSHKYKRELTDWIRLCRRCHWRYDHHRKHLTK